MCESPPSLRPGEVPAARERGVFVAVPAHGGAGDAEAAASPWAERRTAQRRLQDLAMEAALASALWLSAMLAAAAMGAFVLRGPTAWSFAWATLAIAAAAVWYGVPRAAAARGRKRVDTRRRRRDFSALGGLALGLFALAPWLPGADASMAEQALVLAVWAALAMLLAMALAPLPELAGGAVLLPISAGLAAGWEGFAAGLALAAAAGVMALAGHRRWRREARWRLQDQERIRALEQARDEALRADQDKSRFLAIASHDLRQPVHALGLFAATLEKRLHGTREGPLVRNLVRSIDGLDRSFYAMLDISRLDAGTIEPNFQHFPLRDLFRRLHMHYAGQAEQAGLSLRFSPGGKSVTSDPQLLERILGNLIQNAIKYTTHGGIVVVARSTETHFNIEVWDSGVGIRPVDLPRVFEEFYQVGRDERRRVQGLGMGLAIVKRLVRLLGHSLTVASQPRQGTMFRIGIPKGPLPEIQDATAAADTLPMPALQPRMVLIVDDEEAIRDGLVLLLEEWGYQALAAASAEQALHTLRQLDLPPDLILSDLHLGEGPDGIATIDALRRDCGCDVPAILITGDTSNEEMRRASDSGHPVLFKPVQPRKLLNALRGLVS